MGKKGSSFSRIEIQLLGPFDVRLGAAALPPLRSRKGQHLLALLALRQPREVQREWLAANLWPESDLENAYYNLRRTLVGLRSVFGPARDCLQSPTPHSLCLAYDDRIQVDIQTFDTLIRKGDLKSLQEAVELYRGPLLEDWSEEWVLVEREPRQQACLQALNSLAAEAAQQQNWTEAARWLRRLVVLEPFHEEAQRRLIEALAENGDYAAAALAYREYREWLRREMHASPAPETTALFRKIQAEASQNAPLPLRSKVKKEKEQFVGSLPRPLTSFIGRERELEEIQTLLASSRLVTLQGVGGIGKTRLAIRAAEQVAAEFPDGVWFVDLAPLTDPTLLLQVTARVLGLREQAGKPLQQTLRDYLRPRHLLLILDNCEHLVQTCAEFAASLLPACPALHLLATSRQPLGIPEERIWQTLPLNLPEPRHLPAPEEGMAFVLPQYEAARLFVERATEAMPVFTLTEQNAPAALRILRRLDGLPLAIELAAARIRMLTVEQVAARLDNRFRLLTRGSPLAPSRQQTLRAAIDWSYDLLSEPEKTLFRRLSVFSGGWTLEAAEAICANGGRREVGRGTSHQEGSAAGSQMHGDSSTGLFPLSSSLLPSEVLDLLTDLTEKSLVFVAGEAGGERRYRLLETIREYAQEKLTESGEAEAVYALHRDWFLQFALTAEPQLQGQEQAQWMERLEADHDNLRIALESCLKQRPETALRMANALAWFWNVHGHLTEGRGWLQAALKHPATQTRDSDRAKALNAVGLLAWNQSDFPAAQAHHEESLAIHRETGDQMGMARSLNSLGLVAWSRGEYAVARPLFEESLERDHQMGGTSLRPRILNNLGLIAWKQGDYTAAQALMEECLALQKESGDTWGVASTLNNLGGVAFDSNDTEGAYAFFQECLALRRQMDDLWGLACALDNLGIVVQHQGDMETARNLYEDGLKIRRELGNRQDIAGSLGNLGGIAMRKGDFEKAHTLFTESLNLFREIGYTQGLAEMMEAFGALEAAQGQTVRAARLWGKAEDLREVHGIPIPAPLRAARDEYIDPARRLLGEEAFAAAWAAGRALTMEAALNELDSARKR